MMAQATTTALKFDDSTDQYEAKTRKEALDSVLNGEAITASHEHAVNPLVHHAANHLIQNKRTLDIELFGFPYEVLEQASTQLEQAGISSGIAKSLIEALEEYILNMGTDFTRAAKAKPLYARFKVTDHEPEDLPECEQSQATFMDGVKSYGGDSARVIRYMSLFGPKSTTSQGVDMNAMFASKNIGLFVFFGSPSNESVKGFDGVDNALMNAVQGLGGAGGSLSEEAMTELKEMIQNGDITPEALNLLENLAELAQLQEAMLTPNAVENAEAKLSELTKEISEQIAHGIEEGLIPPSVASATVGILAEARQTNVLASIIDQEVVQNLLPDNDNPESSQAIETLIEKLDDLSAIGSENLLELIQELSQTENLPPAIENLIDGVDIDTLTADTLSEALSTDATSDLSQTIQELTIALNNPEIQTALPQTSLNAVNSFLSNHGTLVEAVSTQTIVQNIEKILETTSLDSPEIQDVRQIVESLKSGEISINSVDSTSLKAIAQQLDTSNFSVLENTVTTVETLSASNVLLTNDTINALDNMHQSPNLLPATQESLATALKTNDSPRILDIISQNPEILPSLPKPIQNDINRTIEVRQETPSRPTISQNPTQHTPNPSQPDNGVKQNLEKNPNNVPDRNEPVVKTEQKPEVKTLPEKQKPETTNDNKPRNDGPKDKDNPDNKKEKPKTKGPCEDKSCADCGICFAAAASPREEKAIANEAVEKFRARIEGTLDSSSENLTRQEYSTAEQSHSVEDNGTHKTETVISPDNEFEQRPKPEIVVDNGDPDTKPGGPKNKPNGGPCENKRCADCGICFAEAVSPKEEKAIANEAAEKFRARMSIAHREPKAA